MSFSSLGMQAPWHFITDLGDSSVTLPLTLFVLVALISQERWRLGLAWLAAAALCGLGTALTKVMFHSGLVVTAAANISGHTAMSTFVYGGFALVLAAGRRSLPHRVAKLAAVLLVATIALSRLALQAHQWNEVLAGLLAGILSLLLFRLLAGRGEQPLPVLGLLAGAILLVGLMYGLNWPVEGYLSAAGGRLCASLRACLDR